jgi:LPXTG-motif cell wall-anchored protein
MVRSWDHNVLNLDWTGDVYYETVLSNDTFHHAPVAVPGDFVYRTLRVTNDTPCGAELTVSIVNAESVEDPDTVNDKNGAFEDISQLRWDVGGTQGSAVFSDLVATGGRELATIPIAEQATEQVKIAYTFDFDAETGKHMGQVSQELRYDVELILRGDHCASESTGGNKQTGSNSPPPTTPTADPPTVPPSDPPKEDLPVTGSNIAFAAISAAFLIMAGATILSGRRRNRKARAES